METIWPIKKLGEVCQFQFGFSFTASEFNNSAKGMPVIRIGDIDKGVTEKFFDGKFDKRYMVKKGDILIGLSGTIKIAKWVGIDSLLNQRVVKLRDFQDVLPDYLYYFLPQALHDLERKLSGGIIKNVLLPHLENLKILLPSFSEQKKIVEKIEKLFAKIDEVSRLRAESSSASAALLPSTLHQIFNSKIKSQKSKLQFKIQNLTDVIELIMGQSPPSSSYNKNENGLPFYQGKKDFGEISPTPSVWCSIPTKIAEANDILISVRAPVGPVNICKEKSAIGRGLSALRTRKNKLNYMYLYYYLKHIAEQWPGRGSTFSSISKKDFENTKIPLPPLTEQKKIVAYLDALSQKTRELQNLQTQTAADFSTLRQSVLAKAFEQL